MLGRISRGLGHKSGGKQGTKYRFDVVVEKLDNLPSPVKRCRVVWSRGPKLQMTEVKDVSKGAVLFKQKLSQIATLYRDAKGGFEAKEYKFQVQVPGKEDNKLLTVGRADLDMSLYVLAEGTPQNKMIPIMFKVGVASTGYLKVTITAEAVTSSAGSSDDGMTEVSGMTGMTANLGEDQDLTGFDEDKAVQPSSGPQSGTVSRPSSRLSNAPVSPTKPGTMAAAARTSGAATTSKASAAQGGDDDEISPMSLSPSSSGPTSPRDSSSSRQPQRAAGKPSVLDKAPAAAAARAQLLGTAVIKTSDAAVTASSTSSSRKSDALLPEEEARAALFGSNSSKPKPGAASASQGPTSRNSSISTSSKSVAATEAPKLAPAKNAVATTAGPSRSPSVAASEASASSSSTPAARRPLLDRSALLERQQAQAASSSSETGPSSSKQQAAAPPNTHGHSLSDSDDDSIARQQAPQAGIKQQGIQTPSRARQQPQQQQPAPAPAPADASTVTAKVLSGENEKLKAQLLALRQQAAEAEEARRMAVLAANNVTIERDEYQSQVQELQEQLKEALVSLVTPEEAAELRQELQATQQLLAHQQQQQQEQQQEHEAEICALENECSRLKQHMQEAQDAALEASQEAAQHVQQLRAHADSQETLMRHMSWQLEAAQQALQQQQQEEQPPGACAVSESLTSQLAAAQDRASSAERQCHQVLELLSNEVQGISQHSLMEQTLTTQLLEGASNMLLDLDLDSTLQGPVLDILCGLRAAKAMLQQQATAKASQEDSLQQLTAALTAAKQENAHLKQQYSSHANSTAADIQRLQVEVQQLQQYNEQLHQQAREHQQVQQPTIPVPPGLHSLNIPAKLAEQHASGDQNVGSPRIKAAMTGTNQLDGPGSTAGLAQECGSLKQLLQAAKHKVSKLTAARDKLEIILHDLEASAADEQQQLEHQLAAANQALRRNTQQLSAVQQQLTDVQGQLHNSQHDLADTQQQLLAAQQQLTHKGQQEAQLLQQAADTASELQLLRQQASAACDPPVQVIAMAENAGPSGVEQALAAAQEQAADLQRQLAEADSVRRGLEQDLLRTRRQLADEQAERSTLEEHMMTRLEDVGDDVAQETVAAYEAKYNRLKSRYRELTELHREEVDKLHEEIDKLQERVVELETLAAQLEAAKTQAQHGEITLADTLAKASKASSELAALRTENQMLMQSLVVAKLELAQCSERDIISRHELYKARETNLKLASKMTKLETLVYAKK